MTDAELEIMLERAAKKGAAQALRDVGLHDDDAADDVRELRSLLDAWKDTRRTITQTITRSVTIAILGALAAGAYMKLGGK